MADDLEMMKDFADCAAKYPRQMSMAPGSHGGYRFSDANLAWDFYRAGRLATQAGALQAVAWTLPDPKNGYVDVPMYSGDEVREIVASALAATQPNAAPGDGQVDNPWKAAIDEALIVNCLDCIGPNDDPTKTLARLIGWEVRVALDPAVSQAAADLIEQGKAIAAPSTATAAREQPMFKHTKTGGSYEFIGNARLQTDAALNDMAYLVLYKGQDGGLWARPSDEFTERFEPSNKPALMIRSDEFLPRGVLASRNEAPAAPSAEGQGARYSFVCNAGCGVCAVKVRPFEYERTETLEGEHLGSKYQPQIVSSCCGAEVHVYDNEADHWGAEVTLASEPQPIAGSGGTSSKEGV